MRSPRRHLWLLPAAAALLACCVAARMRLLSLLLSWASGVQLTVSRLTLDVTRAPSSITIVAHEMLAYSPGAYITSVARDHHLLANVSRATIRLRRPETCAAASRLACLLDFRGDVSVEGGTSGPRRDTVVSTCGECGQGWAAGRAAARGVTVEAPPSEQPRQLGLCPGECRGRASPLHLVRRAARRHQRQAARTRTGRR